jgi:hypothetical protein
VAVPLPASRPGGGQLPAGSRKWEGVDMNLNLEIIGMIYPLNEPSLFNSFNRLTYQLDEMNDEQITNDEE